jgi:hypothetical protein
MIAQDGAQRSPGKFPSKNLSRLNGPRKTLHDVSLVSGHGFSRADKPFLMIIPSRLQPASELWQRVFQHLVTPAADSSLYYPAFCKIDRSSTCMHPDVSAKAKLRFASSSFISASR